MELPRNSIRLDSERDRDSKIASSSSPSALCGASVTCDGRANASIPSITIIRRSTSFITSGINLFQHSGASLRSHISWAKARIETSGLWISCATTAAKGPRSINLFLRRISPSNRRYLILSATSAATEKQVCRGFGIQHQDADEFFIEDHQHVYTGFELLQLMTQSHRPLFCSTAG